MNTAQLVCRLHPDLLQGISFSLSLNHTHKYIVHYRISLVCPKNQKNLYKVRNLEEKKWLSPRHCLSTAKPWEQFKLLNFDSIKNVTILDLWTNFPQLFMPAFKTS